MIDKIQLSRYKTNAVQGQKKTSTYYPNAYDNLFSNYLNSLSNNSPTLQCIIDDIAQEVVSLGLTCPDKEQAARLKEFFKKKSITAMAMGLISQESVSIEIRRNPLKDIIAVENINVAHFRVTHLDDGTPDQFAYREDWNPTSSLHKSNNSYINSYNNEDEKSLLYYYDSGTFNTPYGRPRYLSATDAIELEIAIYMMHNHGAQNGMFPSMVVSKESSGDANTDREDAIATQSQTTGAANAGKVVTTYYREGGNAPTFSTPNMTGIDKVYENQYATSEIGILKAFRIPSANLISGLNSKGAGFTSETEELIFATERMRVKIIEPRRQQLLEILQPIFAELGIKDVSFREVEEETSIVTLPNAEGVTDTASKTQEEIDIAGKDGATSYNGAQIASALGIMENVKEGILTMDQAKVFLIQMLKFTPELAEELFQKELEVERVLSENPEADLNNVNESVKNLTGRQMQGIERIVRKFDQGKLTGSQARLMLQSGFGFTEDEAQVWLENDELLSKITLGAASDFDDQSMLDALEVGESIDLDEWELVGVREENGESTEDWANSLIKQNLSTIEKLKDFVTSRPNKESNLDKDYYKIRYSYQQKYASAKSRRFCSQMMGRTGRGVVYRKEDIDSASEDGVNNNFGHNGQNYSLFRYKGGVQCGHYWQEELYRMKSKTELYISRGKNVKNIPDKKKPRGSAYRDAKKAPKDMPRNGAYPK